MHGRLYTNQAHRKPVRQEGDGGQHKRVEQRAVGITRHPHPNKGVQRTGDSAVFSPIRGSHTCHPPLTPDVRRKGGNVAHPLNTVDKEKWRGYYAETQAGTPQSAIRVGDLSRNLRAWIGSSVNPEGPNVRSSIAEVSENGVIIDLPSGRRHVCSFREMINAEAVIRYWLSRDMAPVGADFRKPTPEANVPSIANSYYAPTLVERVKRQIQQKA